MLAFMYENNKVCVFVNRALDMYMCKLNFRRPIYDGTILEGEMYEDTFMIYDCLYDSGTVVGQHDFLTRLTHCENVCKKLLALKGDSVKLCVKTFHLLTDFDSFLNEYLPSVTQDVDGLIFTPIHCPVKIGTHETMFKWKPKNKNTVDFQLKKIDKEWRLYAQEKGEPIYESTIPPNRMDESWYRHNAIVECEYVTDDIPMWWRPLKMRTDKTHANNRRTFYRTLVNIKEDIQITDFLKCM